MQNMITMKRCDECEMGFSPFEIEEFSRLICICNNGILLDLLTTITQSMLILLMLVIHLHLHLLYLHVTFSSPGLGVVVGLVIGLVIVFV